MRKVILSLLILLSSAALAQDPDQGLPGHPGGSWTGELNPKEYNDRLAPEDVPQETPEEIPQDVPQETPEAVPAPAAEWDPGCTPKADTPETVTTYFRQYNRPIPSMYCEGQKQEPSNAQTEPELEGGPNEQQQEPSVSEDAPEAPPPPVQHERPRPPVQHVNPPPVYGGDYSPNGGINVVTPFFQLHIAPHQRVWRQQQRWNRKQWRKQRRQWRRYG